MRSPWRPPVVAGWLLAVTFCLALVAGCGSTSGDKKVDYTQARPGEALEVPPDLTQIDHGAVASVPESAVTASGTATTAAAAASSGTASRSQVLPDWDNAAMKRDGSLRWLEVDGDPSRVWTDVLSFWTIQGVPLVVQRPDAGIMETDWLENRAKINTIFQKLSRTLFRPIAAGAYLDKYRVRLEEAETPGKTEIYVSHQGLVENIDPGPDKKVNLDDPDYVRRDPEPDLEVEIMRLMLVHLGVGEDTAGAIVATEQARPAGRSRLTTDANGDTVVAVSDGYERTWRRTGLALDRSGYSIEGRSREDGYFDIRLVDPDAIARQREQGFFSRLFSRDDNADPDFSARIQLTDLGDRTLVAVQTPGGETDKSETASQILAQLEQELR